jgi:hypothetical protein
MKKTRSRLPSLAVVLAASLVLVSSSCSDPEPPEGKPIDFSSSKGTEGSGLEFKAPEGWIEESPSSAMRRSQFRLPGSKPNGGDAEVAVFAGIGGSVEQNVTRWINQFQDADSPQVSKRMINDFQVTLVDVSGVFSTGMMGGQAEAKPGYRMLAAVIETGEAPWFVKMVGPQDTVTKWEASFNSFVESVR